LRGGLPRIPWAFLFIAGSSRAYSWVRDRGRGRVSVSVRVRVRVRGRGRGRVRVRVRGRDGVRTSAEAAPDLPPSSSTASQCRVRHSPRRPGEAEAEA